MPPPKGWASCGIQLEKGSGAMLWTLFPDEGLQTLFIDFYKVGILKPWIDQNLGLWKKHQSICQRMWLQIWLASQQVKRGEGGRGARQSRARRFSHKLKEVHPLGHLVSRQQQWERSTCSSIKELLNGLHQPCPFHRILCSTKKEWGQCGGSLKN